MGMGEPLANFRNVVPALDILLDDFGFDLSRRRVTLSTSVLVPQIGSIERVSYHLGDWDTAPRRIRFDGAVVRLGGYHWQRAAAVDVITARRT